MKTTNQPSSGYLVSRFNAIKHGILCKSTLAKSENDKDLEKLERALRQEFRPSSPMELILVDRIASCYWRLRRLVQSETDVVNHVRTTQQQNEATHTYLSTHLQIQESQKEKEQTDARNGKAGSEYNPLLAIDTDKLTRYERSIENSLFRSLKQLEQLQSQKARYTDVNI